jgi:TPR repeat protein
MGMKKGLLFFAMLPLAFTVGTAGVTPASKAKDTPAKATATRKAAEKEPEKETEPPREVAPQSPVAINSMANMYYRGDGVKQDYVKALYLYKKAAGQGHMASVITVGYMYEYGQGTRVDYAVAMQWYQRAAAQGYASAQKAIGDLYRFGRGVAKDDATAAQWYRKAADQKFAEAQCRLGYMMLRGSGMAADPGKARALFEEGAAQNNACSQHYLAFMYMSGMITALPDTRRALELDKLAAGNGDPEAQYNMGKANEIGWLEYSTEAEALNWYTHSATRGYPLAMERLAKVYENGELKEKPNPEKAAMWRQRAQAAWATWPEPRPDSMENIRFMPPK